MPDRLSSLNESERRILLLLGQGHTAKSVAAETGASVNSVNERLREARRKTGTGSSRELARMLAETSQENRDEEIGVGTPHAAPAPKWRIPDWRWIAMTVFALAAATFFLAPQNSPEPPRLLSYQAEGGGQLHAGKIAIEFIFDRPMRRGSYSFVRVDDRSYPDCSNTPHQSADGRRFYLDCTLESGRNYAIGINVGHYRNFAAASDGTPAAATTLKFAVR